MRKPYVYALIDPRDGGTFYIGKGNGRRMYQHENCVRRGKVCNQAKSERIKAILSEGFSVQCAVLAEYTTEAEAFAGECDFIAAHENLTNANRGGGGTSAGFARAENPSVTLIKINALIARTKNYVDWMNEKARSNQESDVFRAVVREMHEIAEWCHKRIAAPAGARLEAVT